MTLGFFSGSRNFCYLLWVSFEVWVLHGYAWIHWVAWSCTTTSYRWLFRLSLRTLWSAVIKSPKFAARGTASPLRLLHGALVILARLQISQFRSSGNWVWTLCLPKSSCLFVVGSQETSWEELAWESPCTGISSSTKISLNSCSHSGISESPHGFLRSFGVFFLFVFWVSLARVSTGFPVLSSTNSDIGIGEKSLIGTTSLFRTRIWPSVGEVDVVEEDDEEWLSCLEGVFEFDEDPEDELDKPGTTIGTKFSVLQIIRIPS